MRLLFLSAFLLFDKIFAASANFSQPFATKALTPKVVASHGASIWQLFWSADLSIKLIMGGLLLASVWSWTIIISKIYRLKQLNKMTDKFEDIFWSGTPLDELFENIKTKSMDPMASVFCAAMREWKRASSRHPGPKLHESKITLSERLDRVMHVVCGREINMLEKNMGFLSSLGSNGMIVGLFGTVLGIMNSFQAIASQQNTNLAVVAPGIAEALFATAVGLIAAIPASIAYNKLSSDIHRYANRLESFSSEFNMILSRQLDEAA